MDRKQEDAEYFAEIETGVSDAYTEGKILEAWADSKETFVSDIMDLIKASYEAGYDSAIYDGQKALGKLGY